MQSLKFLPFPTTMSESATNGYIGTYVPQTQPYMYPFYYLDGVIRWS